MYLATHVFNSVVRIQSDGGRCRIAGGLEDTTVVGTTATAFGRTLADKTEPYVTTNGGMSSPINGQIGPARLSTIETRKPGVVANEVQSEKGE